MNWFKTPRLTHKSPFETSSILHDEKTFYKQFTHDLLEAKQEVIIESPFLATKRLNMLKPTFEKLIERSVEVFVMTRDPLEHDEFLSEQAEAGIRYFEVLGIKTLLCDGGHHRKLAMIDRKVTWEGSLNILSQTHSREIMRRIENKEMAAETFQFLRLGRFI